MKPELERHLDLNLPLRRKSRRFLNRDMNLEPEPHLRLNLHLNPRLELNLGGNLNLPAVPTSKGSAAGTVYDVKTGKPWKQNQGESRVA
jgi:hypothetical protein